MDDEIAQLKRQAHSHPDSFSLWLELSSRYKRFGDDPSPPCFRVESKRSPWEACRSSFYSAHFALDVSARQFWNSIESVGDGCLSLHTEKGLPAASVEQEQSQVKTKKPDKIDYVLRALGSDGVLGEVIVTAPWKGIMFFDPGDRAFVDLISPNSKDLVGAILIPARAQLQPVQAAKHRVCELCYRNWREKKERQKLADPPSLTSGWRRFFSWIG